MRILIDASRVGAVGTAERSFFRDLVRNLLLRDGRHTYRIVGWKGRRWGDLAAFLSPIPRNAPAWSVEPTADGVAAFRDRARGSLLFAPLGTEPAAQAAGPSALPTVTILMDPHDGTPGDPGSWPGRDAYAVALTHATQETLRSHPCAPHRVPWIPPPAGTYASWDPAGPPELRQTGSYLVACSEAATPADFRRLLEGFRIYLRGTGSGVRLLVLGRPRLALRRLAWWGGMSGSVRFAGSLSRTARRMILASARAFVAFADHDRTWFSAGEAMASGLPVVLPHHGRLSELVGEAGLHYDGENPADLASQLWRCLEEDDLPRTLAQRSLTRARSLSWESFTMRLLDFFSEVEQDLADRHEHQLEALSRI